MSSQPNILFMIADDHRWDAIGGMGDPTVKTPTLDSLMDRGTTFRQTHIMGSLVGAVCVPSRAAVLTSANLFRSGGNQLNPRFSSLATGHARDRIPHIFFWQVAQRSTHLYQ